MARNLVIGLVVHPLLLAWTSRTEAQIGTVLDQHKISALEGGFTGVLEEDDYFGNSLVSLGDLDGDGIPELAASAYGDDEGGAVWILSFQPDGRVRRQAKLTGTGVNYYQSLACPGDLDGDGLRELAVGNYDLVTPTVDILFLRPDGTVRAVQSIPHTDPVFIPRITGEINDGFGIGIAGLGDLDGDGVGDLGIGAPFDDNGPGQENGALWIVYLERDGRARAAHKINEVHGGGEGLLDTHDLGEAFVSLGDLDGDGNTDLLAADSPRFPYPYLPSWLLILHLDADERLRAVTRISQEELGLVGDGEGHNLRVGFGSSLTSMGDIDADGTLEFGVGAPFWTPSPETPAETTPWQGAVLIGSLRRDGTLARSRLISAGRGGFSANVPENTGFGSSVAAAGDIDGDGVTELAVGAPQDHDAGEDTGAVWILDLDGSAVRNGSGSNPLTLGESGEPVLGQSWKLVLDCSAHAPGTALIAGCAAPHAGLTTSAGELLVDLASLLLFTRTAAHAGAAAPFVVPVPKDAALFGRVVHVQGLCTGAPRPQLSNALDVIVGR